MHNLPQSHFLLSPRKTILFICFILFCMDCENKNMLTVTQLTIFEGNHNHYRDHIIRFYKTIIFKVDPQLRSRVLNYL